MTAISIEELAARLGAAGLLSPAVGAKLATFGPDDSVHRPHALELSDGVFVEMGKATDADLRDALEVEAHRRDRSRFFAVALIAGHALPFDRTLGEAFPEHFGEVAS